MAPKGSILPREGFVYDALHALVKKTIFNPLLTLPAYLGLVYTPFGRELAAGRLTWVQRLKLLVIFGAITKANAFLNNKSLNNWKSDKWDWEKEIVVITGGCGGIGEGIVRELAARSPKTRIVVLDLLPWSGEELPNVTVLKVNLADRDSVREVANHIRTTIGAPTVLVNNAGVCRGKTILEATPADLNLVYNVNVLSHFYLAQEFLPSMISSNHGHIITVASIGAYVQAPKMVDYNSSKAAVLSFHEGLGLELKHTYKADKVRTTLVTQGYARTPLFQGYKQDSTFFLPSLEPETVSDAIVDAVLGGESGHITLPVAYNALQSIRGWAHWLQRRVRDKTSNLMSSYSGRQVIDPNAGKQ